MRVLLIILAIIILFCNISGIIEVQYADGSLSYCVKYAFIKLFSNNKKPKKLKKNEPVKEELKQEKINKAEETKKEKNKVEKTKKEKKKKDKAEESNSLDDKFEKIGALIEFVKSSEKYIFYLFRKVRFSGINVDFIVADMDAYDCALRYGAVSAGIYNILGFISSYFKTDIDNLNIDLKYNNNNSVYNFAFKVKLKLGTGIIAGIGIVLTYLTKGRVPKRKKMCQQDISKECLNMSDHPVNGLMGTAIDKIRDMIDVNTIIGNPISTPEGATIIPVSKVSFGFASGGSDLPSKNPKDLFGGAAGAGVSVQPLAFICVSPSGDVKLMQMSVNASKENAIINTIPELIDKISELVSGKGKNKDKAEKSDKNTSVVSE